MKILVTSDIHSRISNLERIVKMESFDLLLIAGDLSNFSLDDVLKIDEVLSRNGIECYAVHGNCDYEEVLSLEFDSLNFIHGKSKKVDEIKIHGIGGSLPTPFATPSEYPESYFAEILKNFELSDFDILLSHTPAKGILDRTKHGENIGSEEIKKRLGDFDLAITGHVHECYGISRDITTVVNPGPVAWNMFAVIELEEMRVELKRAKL